MSHLLLLYAPSDHPFALQLAVHLQQRGLVLWPVPDPNAPPVLPVPDPEQGIVNASHILIVLSAEALATEAWLHQFEPVLTPDRHTILVLCKDCLIPDSLKKYPAVHFEEQYLPAVEDLVRLLKKAKAPTRPLTVEHPPPVVKTGLLPMRLPAERCWREDRLRINYSLPIILDEDELAARVPAFFAAAKFEQVRVTPKSIRARRLQRNFSIFDPRRAEHSITIKRRKGRLRVYYSMTRMQIYYWFPAHYFVLDRESAALFRYLATGNLDGIFDPVNTQARRARTVSWGSILVVLLILMTVMYLILI